jgi:hypothetical protein
VSASGSAGASAPVATARAERAQLAKERAAANERYAERERECRQRFVVTSCIDEAKHDRREALDALRKRQIVLDEATRHERASQRQSELAAKAAEDAKADRERSARRAAQAAPAAASQAASAAEGPRRAPARPHVAGAKRLPSAEEREAKEARSRASFEARQHQAAVHRDEAAAAAIRRMANKPPAPSLPTPSAAAASR